ncbi:hypothetical protein [Rhizobium sp. MHM7A]|uniref:hypothetical protein n=1 Tax=Rhizobium sp. MHM7A TaxID=2583233 RepID=UPI00110660D5|nr:hypothetical protein [Rhizobium sp. MHM7A]TLX16765.1 hypothetical protein FFR93_05320 [Rhizobium sp. MHM7A]
MSTEKQTEVSWYDRLSADYPGYVTRFPECNEGWDRLLRGFFEVVMASGVKPEQFDLRQIKEKWGELVIYYYFKDEVDEETIDRIRAAYHAAEEASRETCEITGKPGVLIERGGWYLVRSPEYIQPGDNIDGPIPETLKEAVDKALAGSGVAGEA